MEVSYKPPPVKVDLGFVQLGDFWQRGDPHVEKRDGADEHAKEEVANPIVIGKGGSGGVILQDVAANACPGQACYLESYQKYSNKAFLSPVRADINTCHERLQSREENERNLAEDSYTEEKSREKEEKNTIIKHY